MSSHGGEPGGMGRSHGQREQEAAQAGGERPHDDTEWHCRDADAQDDGAEQDQQENPHIRMTSDTLLGLDRVESAGQTWVLPVQMVRDVVEPALFLVGQHVCLPVQLTVAGAPAPTASSVAGRTRL